MTFEVWSAGGACWVVTTFHGRGEGNTFPEEKTRAFANWAVASGGFRIY